MHWLHTHGTRLVKSRKKESEAGETASTARQIDRDALIEILRGPYATYEEQADAVMALLGGDVQITLGRPGKSREQEKKFHAMINDIHQQCFRGYSFDGVKAVLVNQFALEREEQGEPLAHPGERVWDWKTKEPVYVRPSTTKFRKAEAADFIEFLYATGSEFDVKWSDMSLKVYDEMIEARAA